MISIATDEQQNNPLIKLGRLLLWLAVLTAGTKPVEVFGMGEQVWGAPPIIDTAMRALILLGCATACGIALLTGRVRRESLLFIPFVAWAMIVTVVLQSDFGTAKQIGSYASWICFYIGARSLLDRENDFRTLAYVMVGAVFVSALGGEVQHLLGYAPQLGSRWPDSPDMEFMRTHTGGGGILLDAFTPYCAAILLISVAGSSRLKHIGAWLLILWGTANILRGGMLALLAGLSWYLWLAPSRARRRVVPFVLCGLICGVVLFGSTIAAKMTGPDDEISTSGRLDTWPQLVAWIQEEPFLGHGPDADMELLEKSYGSDLRASHNELLSTGINFGLIGIFLLWSPLLFLLYRNMSESAACPAESREEAGGASAILLMVVILSFTDNTLRSPGPMMIALAPVAIARIGESRKPRAESEAVLHEQYI